jgi:hypothetical protein
VWALWKPIVLVLVPMVLVMMQPDLGTMIVFAFLLLACALLGRNADAHDLLPDQPGARLVLAFNTWIWGAWFVLLAVASWRGGRGIAEGATVLLLNVVVGMIALPFWDSLATYQRTGSWSSSTRHRPARRGIQPDPVAGRGRQRRADGEGLPRGHAEAARLPARAAHRLHLLRGRRGVGVHRGGGGAAHLRA